MARRSVGVSGLKAMARALDRLPDDVGRAVQEALNDTAVSAQRRVGRGFETEIEGGPTSFTKVKPEKRSSSVLARDRTYRKNRDPESSTAVQKLQSSYLKYMLGEDDDGVREPGDVSIATKRNFVPVDRPSLRKVGVRITKQGNVAGKALPKLIEKAKRRKRRRAADIADDAERDAFLGSFTRGKRGRFAKGDGPKAARTDADDGVFFGRPKGRGRGVRGVWMRVPGTARKGRKIRLLMLMLDESRYPKAYLVPAWNKAHAAAAKQVYRRSEVHLARILRAKSVRATT